MSQHPEKPGVPDPGGSTPPTTPAPAPPQQEASKDVTTTSYSQNVDDSYGYYDDPYAYESNTVPVAQEQAAAPPPPPPPPPAEDDEEADPDEEGMLRMSFLEHLEELRGRLISALTGMVVAFVVSIAFAGELWKIVSAPAIDALKQLNVNPPKLAQLAPMEAFSTVWVKLPLLTSIFLASPWILYQVWSFIAPGLYKRERRWAGPFVIISAGLFILGGLFAYHVAFRYGLVFLLGIGRDIDINPVVSITEYFDLFVNVTLGIALVFELPVIIFFLTLLRLASPRFLFEHSRYAILAIVVVAAIITPTPDIFNLLLFAVPMVLLYFVGVFASYLLVLNREGEKFPWKTVILVVLGIVAIVAAMVALAILKYGYHWVWAWPFLVK